MYNQTEKPSTTFTYDQMHSLRSALGTLVMTLEILGETQTDKTFIEMGKRHTDKMEKILNGI